MSSNNVKTIKERVFRLIGACLMLFAFAAVFIVGAQPQAAFADIALSDSDRSNLGKNREDIETNPAIWVGVGVASLAVVVGIVFIFIARRKDHEEIYIQKALAERAAEKAKKDPANRAKTDGQKKGHANKRRKKKK